MRVDLVDKKYLIAKKKLDNQVHEKEESLGNINNVSMLLILRLIEDRLDNINHVLKNLDVDKILESTDKISK